MIPPAPTSGRFTPAPPPEKRRELLRRPHPLDGRDLFATDANEAVRELGLLALRRADVNDQFALGDLCATLTVGEGDRLRVFYAGKALLAYRRAYDHAAGDVDRALAVRARDRFIEWVIEAARAAPTRRNVAVALWVLFDDDDPMGTATLGPPRRAPADLLAHLHPGAVLPLSSAPASRDETHVTHGDRTEFAVAIDPVPQSEVEAGQSDESGHTQADMPTRLLAAEMLASPGSPVEEMPRRSIYVEPPLDDGEFKVGERIMDRFEVAEVKYGGMGVVYLCYDHDDREPVALKSFQTRYLDNPRALARFEQEALTWIQLERHRHVVTAKLVQTIAGRPFILLEHISGPEGLGADLRGWIEHHRLDQARAALFALHIALGMRHLHSASGHGLVHRDLKPANILVTQDGIAKVTDFGLVRSLDRDERSPDRSAAEVIAAEDARLTRFGFQVGTIMYMAPEQWELLEVDQRTDIYAYGLIVYEMLTGRHALADANARERSEWQRAHMTHEVTFSAQESEHIHPALRALVLNCAAKAREQRPATWEGIINTLSDAYAQIAGQPPPLDPTAPELQTRDLMDKGYSLTELGRFEDALAVYDEVLASQPGFAPAWTRRGRALRMMGRFDDAIAAYDQALALSPRSAKAWRGRGMVLEMRGQKAEALLCYQRAAERDPGDMWNWYSQADMLSALGRTDEALLALNTALRLDPSHANSWAMLGQLYRQQGELDRARLAYENALRLNPRFAWAHNGYGQLLRALGAPREALMAFKRAARHQPSNAQFWDHLTDTLIELGDLAEAHAAAQQAVRLAPKAANAWAKLGLVLRYLGRFDEALDAYDQALAIEPDFAWAITGMGIAYQQMGRYGDALSAFERAAALDAGNVSYLFNLGDALGQLERYDEAIAHIKQVVALNPMEPRAWQRLGAFNRAQGRLADALEAYQQAVQVDPQFAWAWMEIGFTLQALHQPAEALAAFRQAEAVAPAEVAFLLPQADLLSEQGDHAAALALLERALKLDGRSARIWTKLGLTLRALKRFNEALTAFGAAIACDATAAAAWSAQGGTLSMLGRHEEALESLRHALDLTPDDPLTQVQQGEALMLLNLPRAAADAFERAVALAPGRAENWAKLGQALRRLEKPDMALTAYDRALALNDRYAWAWEGRGQALEALDRCEEAEACYVKALAIDDSLAFIHISRIDVLLKMQHAAAALEACNTLVARHPKQAIGWGRRGQALRHLKRYGDALADYDRALALDPIDAWAWNGRGMALAALNRWDEALESFQNAMLHDAAAVWYYHNCGEAWLMLDNPQKAIAVLEAGLVVDSAHEPTRRMLARARAALD